MNSKAVSLSNINTRDSVADAPRSDCLARPIPLGRPNGTRSTAHSHSPAKERQKAHKLSRLWPCTRAANLGYRQTGSHAQIAPGMDHVVVRSHLASFKSHTDPF